MNLTKFAVGAAMMIAGGYMIKKFGDEVVAETNKTLSEHDEVPLTEDLYPEDEAFGYHDGPVIPERDFEQEGPCDIAEDTSEFDNVHEDSSEPKI